MFGFLILICCEKKVGQLRIKRGDIGGRICFKRALPNAGMRSFVTVRRYASEKVFSRTLPRLFKPRRRPLAESGDTVARIADSGYFGRALRDLLFLGETFGVGA